jgi:hypothetical protein
VKLTVAVATALVAALAVLPAQAARRAVFTLAIGYNGAPQGPDGAGVRPLHYADDDAARVYALGSQTGRWSRLLSLLDSETSGRLPELADQARPPSRAELLRAVSELKAAAARAAAAGDQPVAVIYYSGHGAGRPDGSASLTLLDGPLTQRQLYDDVLAPLDGLVVHLLVDACHAEAVVRPRDAQAAIVDIPAAQIAAYLDSTTLTRFPRVGLIVASSRDAQAHEWDAYEGGVFTHELLSGLRGAADVNGDGRVEYSEMAAFLAAANRAVSTPQARLRTVVQAPPAQPRAPLATLGTGRGGWLEGRPAFLGGLHVEDGRGDRLVDLRSEPGARIALLLPTGVPLYVRTQEREAELRLRPGEHVDFAALSFKQAALRPRGAVDTSLRQGLFATAFGGSYYRGFVDSQSALVSVELPAGDLGLVDNTPPPAPPVRHREAAAMALGAAGALGVTSAIFGVATWRARDDYANAVTAREIDDAASRYDRHRLTALGTGGAAVIAAGLGLYLWWSETHHGP